MREARNPGLGTSRLTFGLFLVLISTTVVSVEHSVAEAVASTCPTALEGRFIESAPRDRFEFTNQSASGWSIARIKLDLETSVGDLIFDTADGGQGVEVYQPYRIEQSTAEISRATLPGDGDQVIVLDFKTFAPNDSFIFSIDVDDQLVDSSLGQIRVAGSEIRLARVTTLFKHTDGKQQMTVTAFNEHARVVTDC